MHMKLPLAFHSTLTMGGLFFDGIAQSAGTWGATGSGATFTNDDWFTGTGTLTVVPEPDARLYLAVGLAGLTILQRRRARI